MMNNQAFEDYLLPEVEMMNYMPGESERRTAHGLLQEIDIYFEHEFKQKNEEEPSESSQLAENAPTEFIPH